MNDLLECIYICFRFYTLRERVVDVSVYIHIYTIFPLPTPEPQFPGKFPSLFQIYSIKAISFPWLLYDWARFAENGRIWYR